MPEYELTKDMFDPEIRKEELELQKTTTKNKRRPDHTNLQVYIDIRQHARMLRILVNKGILPKTDSEAVRFVISFFCEKLNGELFKSVEEAQAYIADIRRQRGNLSEIPASVLMDALESKPKESTLSKLMDIVTTEEQGEE